MSTIVITPPSIEPLTLEEALQHLRADAGAEDALVSALITAAREAAEHRTGRALMLQTRQTTLDAFPVGIRLDGAPVVDVLSITYTATDGVDVVLDPADYTLDTLSTPAWVVPAYGVSWPSTLCTVNAVRVVYRCGYSTSATPATARAAVPAGIRQWMLLAIGDMYTRRAAGSDRPSVQHHFVDRLLDPHTVWTL
ncbi:MAG: hypothetical protein RL375_3803 [Pseudomonadota bacterium]|jgi:uncharacterized phiE125 gp8 family phage protein